jgi:hypothetical protein
MKKIVLTFGLIAGVIMSVLMDSVVLIASKMGSGQSLTIGAAGTIDKEHLDHSSQNFSAQASD